MCHCKTRSTHQQKFRTAPRLIPKHIYPSAFNRMKVMFVSKVFSNSVAAGMYTHVSFAQLPKQAHVPADFIETMGKLFDECNSPPLRTEKIRTALTNDPIQIKFLIYTNVRILNLFNISTTSMDNRHPINCKTIRCVRGWRTTINANLQLSWSSFSHRLCSATMKSVESYDSDANTLSYAKENVLINL